MYSGKFLRNIILCLFRIVQVYWENKYWRSSSDCSTYLAVKKGFAFKSWLCLLTIEEEISKGKRVFITILSNTQAGWERMHLCPLPEFSASVSSSSCQFQHLNCPAGDLGKMLLLSGSQCLLLWGIEHPSKAACSLSGQHRLLESSAGLCLLVLHFIMAT